MGLASSQRERLESPAIMSSFSFQGGNVRTLEMELTRIKLQSVCAVLNMAQTRLLAYAFRRYAAAQHCCHFPPFHLVLYLEETELISMTFHVCLCCCFL